MSDSRPQVGQSVSRLDARRLASGAGAFLDDLQFPRMLHVAFVRSPYAHARIVSVDASAAEAMPGIERIVTGTDLQGVCRAFQVKMPSLQMPPAEAQIPLALERVRWHGEPVVVVVARTRREAEDAAEAVVVDFEELPPITTIEEALGEAGSENKTASDAELAFEQTVIHGDPDASFAAAATVVGLRLRFDRQTGVPLEPRGIIASYTISSGELLIHQSHQSPFQTRDVLAEVLGLPAHKIRVVVPDVGGAFGTKLHAYPDEVAVAAVAVLMGRCLKYQPDRMESFLSDAHAREAVCDARLAIDSAGRFLAFEVDAVSGFGAYQSYPRGSVGEGLHMMRLVGLPYAFDSFKGRLRCVYQNKVPTGAYRGVGQPLGCTVTETLVELAARKAGMDPADLRRRNYLAADRGDAPTPAGLKVGAVSLHECLDKLLEAMNYAALRSEQSRLREQGVYRGIGLSTFIEMTAVGSWLYGGNAIAVSAQEGCTVRLEPTGTLLCHTSSTDQGQGIRTALAQIVADVFEISTDDVVVRAGDTAASPVGGGTWASRGLAISGEAALLAARELRKSVLSVGARVLKLNEGDLTYAGGRVRALGGRRALSLAEVAQFAYFRQHELGEGPCAEMSVTRHFVPTKFPYLMANGIQASYVEVDTQTGMVHALRHWVVDDCGRIVNPMLVDEQIRGGVVQGLGAALFEQCEYSSSGQLSNGTLADYLLPMASEMPDIDVLHVASVAAETSLGAKGVGEAGTIGAGGAVWNAINDALYPFGVVVAHQPFTPARILAAMADKSGTGERSI